MIVTELVSQGLTHHRASGEKFVVALGHSATGINKVLHRGAHPDEEVARILELLTCHSSITLKEGLVLHHSLIDGKGRSYILHDGTDVHGYSGRCRHLTTDDSIDKLLLTALWIALLKRHHLDGISRAGELLGALLRQELDSRHLIGLDADISSGDLCTLHQQFKTDEDLVGMLHHQTEVGGDVRLALYSIDDDTLGLGCRRRCEFDEGGETGTSHTDDTCSLDAVYNLLGSEFRMVLDGLQLIGAVDGLFPFITFHINNNHGLAIACSINGGIDLEHRSADRREDRG